MKKDLKQRLRRREPRLEEWKGEDAVETKGKEDFEKETQVPNYAQCLPTDREDDAVFRQVELVTDLGRNCLTRREVVEAH